VELEDLNAEEEQVKQQKPQFTWYDRLMVFKALGKEIFDENVLKIVEMDPEAHLSLTFSADVDSRPYADKNNKDLNILHLAC